MLQASINSTTRTAEQLFCLIPLRSGTRNIVYFATHALICLFSFQISRSVTTKVISNSNSSRDTNCSWYDMVEARIA